MKIGAGEWPKPFSILVLVVGRPGDVPDLMATLPDGYYETCKNLAHCFTEAGLPTIAVTVATPHNEVNMSFEQFERNFLD